MQLKSPLYLRCGKQERHSFMILTMMVIRMCWFQVSPTEVQKLPEWIRMNGNFTLMPDPPFGDHTINSMAFSDVDQDGDSDVLIIGTDAQSNKVVKLYKNDGSGLYSEVTDIPFVVVGVL